jgi:hypothetical protein
MVLRTIFRWRRRGAGQPLRQRALEVELLLEEYRTVRAELLAALQAQHSVLSWGIAALALLAIAIANGWNKSARLDALALMSIIPAGIFLILVVWGMEVGRMKRAGSYLGRYLEPAIERAANLSRMPLRWQQWISESNKRARSSRRAQFGRHQIGSSMPRFNNVIAGIFIFFAGASYGIGAYRLHFLAAQEGQAAPWYVKDEVIEMLALGIVCVLFPAFLGWRMYRRDSNYVDPITLENRPSGP